MLEKVKEVVKQYGDIYNLLTDKFKKDKEYIDKNYINSGARWAQKFKEIKEVYDNQLLSAREAARAEIETLINDVISKLNSKIAEGVTTEIVAELDLLRSIKATKDDIQAFLNKYYNNYLVCKAIKEIAEEKEIEITIVTLSDQIKDLLDLKERIFRTIDTYNGPLKSYLNEIIIRGDFIDGVDKQLGIFTKQYGME